MFNSVVILDAAIACYIFCRKHTAVSEKVGLASQFASQNCLSCYSKLNLGSKFLAEVASHLPHINLRTLYTLNIIL